MELTIIAILLALAALGLWRLSRAVRRARARGRLREAVLDSLAHDLRTPLTAVLGAATALESLDGSLTPDRRLALAATAAAGARDLDGVIGRLLDTRRMRASGRADLRACAEAALRRQGAALDGHEVTVTIPDAAAWAAADPVLLELALANLISNAVRHGPARGRIGVAARAAGGTIVLSVADEGPGVPGTARRARRGGGLGLSIARDFAGAMGGALRFAPEGSRTDIVLRRARPLPPGGAARDNAAPVERHV